MVIDNVIFWEHALDKSALMRICLRQKKAQAYIYREYSYIIQTNMLVDLTQIESVGESIKTVSL